ncbi:unnamed protein product [Ambrosiozyma monospora]|uniref:Unnamed protein product n=1 Tax=Ambrosiozyma monospora TaxID=43982 RepID=A0ACB5U6U9_AMBMO|nr:unnamed protein product [Ambrosiozyma monospora]
MTPVNATIEEKEAEAASEAPTVVEEPPDSKAKSESNSDITVDENGHVSIASRFDDDTPFGLPSMKEYLIHTVEVLSPKNAFRYSESLRALSLNILNTIVEVSGGVLPDHPALFQLISDNVCHHIVYMLQHTDSPYLLNLILKLFLHLSINMPHQLKIQLELIFNTLMQIVISKWDELEKDLEKTDQHIFGMSKRGKYETEVLTEKDIEELSKEFHTGKMPSVKEVVIEALSALWNRFDCLINQIDLSSIFI